MSLRLPAVKEQAAAAAVVQVRCRHSEDNKDTVAGGTDCVKLGEMADHEGTRGPHDPDVQRNSEARDGHSGSHQHGPTHETASPIVQEDPK
jgi:hypothetical protein